MVSHRMLENKNKWTADNRTSLSNEFKVQSMTSVGLSVSFQFRKHVQSYYSLQYVSIALEEC